MHRISYTIAVIFSTLLLISICSAQQTSTLDNKNTTSGRDTSPIGIEGPVIGGDGTPNFIPIWRTTSYLTSSAIYQTSNGKVGIGTTTPAATLDVSGIVNATMYNLSGLNVLSAPNNNLFVGIGAGASGAGGGGNTFVGNGAGANNVNGQANTLVGYEAGGGNTNGESFNSFFGWRAGYFNMAGENTFFGYEAGYGNTTGGQNSFFGMSAGVQNGAGTANSFFGYDAGLQKTRRDQTTPFLARMLVGRTLQEAGTFSLGCRQALAIRQATRIFMSAIPARLQETNRSPSA
jgi:hypothetical protein